MFKNSLLTIYNGYDDVVWFYNYIISHCREHTEGWFVIKDKQVLGTYDNFRSAIYQTCKKYKLGTFVVEWYHYTPDIELVLLPKHKYSQYQLSKIYINMLSKDFISAWMSE